ncbi:MAG: hypothetical protein ACWGOX_06530 [Desulforhopalus sp.]
MHLDRKLQLTILLELRENFPNDVAIHRLDCYSEKQYFIANLIYLREHGLVGGDVSEEFSAGGSAKSMTWAIITAKGLDFLEDDGGIKAILTQGTD